MLVGILEQYSFILNIKKGGASSEKMPQVTVRMFPRMAWRSQKFWLVSGW
jgi:hypothetical protein